jgi:hypothetical protein
VPIMLVFRRHCSEAGRTALLDAVVNITSVTAGQQIVALYQSRAFVLRTAAAMRTTVDLLNRYQQLLARRGGESSRTGWWG